MGQINFQIIISELSLKNNNLGDGTYKFSPAFTRMIKSDDKYGYTRIIVEETSTEDNPFPVDIKVDVTAQIELNEIPEDSRKAFLEINAVSVLLPYIRNMITSLTSSALMVPIVLPILNPNDMFIENNE